MGTNFYWASKPYVYTKRTSTENGACSVQLFLNGKWQATMGPFSEGEASDLEYRFRDPARNDDDPKTHIGKRSAAGLYCWDCRTTLCKLGEARIHFSESDDEWSPHCPKCLAKPVKDKMDESPAGRELGFHNNHLVRKGVRGCCSFTYAQHARDVHRRLKDGDMVVDEYGRHYTAKEFLEELEDCPVVFSDMVGRCFS